MDDIQNFLFNQANLPFLIAGYIVVGILVLELIATLFGMSSFGHSDANVDLWVDLDGNGIPDHLEGGHMSIIGWVNPGQIPLMIFLLLFCGTFCLLGFSAQWITRGFTGSLLPVLISIPLLIAITLPPVRTMSRTLSRLIPQDTTSAISTESLSGSGGVVNIGPLTSTTSGVARFTDQFGTDHNLTVFATGDKNIEIGEKVVLLGPHHEKSYAFLVRRI